MTRDQTSTALPTKPSRPHAGPWPIAAEKKIFSHPDMLDIASITPSTRDFLQAIASNRKRLVLVPLIDRVEDAVALAAAGVTAFAVATPGSTLRAVGASTGSAPMLSLALVASRDDALVARAGGADAVVIDTASDPSRWTSLAREASSTRMASLALVGDDATSAVAASGAGRGGDREAGASAGGAPL